MYARAIRPVRWLFGVAALAAAAACVDAPTSVPARAAPAEPSAAIDPGPYTAGQSYTGRNGYIVYYAGNSPFIFAAPHGGSLAPGEIPDRTTATTSCDTTEIVTRADRTPSSW